jgi:hypothetical protein
MSAEIIPLTPDANADSVEEGNKIWRYLRSSYPDNSYEHLDIIMNALCRSLVIHGWRFTAKGAEKGYVKIIAILIERNLIECNKERP